jgi:protein tyrosine phosphatase
MLWNQKASDVLTLVDSPWWPQGEAQYGDILVRRVSTRTKSLPAMAQRELEELVQPWNNDLWLDTLRNSGACTTSDILQTSVYALQRGQETRRVTEHLFTGWPDLGVVHGKTLAELVLTVQDNAGPGPLVVNCLAGVGRTGTYFCADALTRRDPALLKRYGFSATLWEVLKLRLQRPKMVQREVQFFGALAALPHLRH